MRRVFVLTAAAFLLTACQKDSQAQTEACTPLGMSKTELLALRDAGFEGGVGFSYDAFAIELVECFGDPDPALRDTVGYEGFANLLRNKKVSPQTIKLLSRKLTDMITTPDPRGFRPPFAALALSEVARADLFDEIFTDEERAALVDTSATYMRSVTDYRGYDENEGWRHGVAHGADFLMQLSRNEALTRDELVTIRDAIAAQVAPDAHFYIYGEGERLARPILFIAMRGVFTEEEWAGWFAALGGEASPNDAPFTQASLARRHNLKAFASAIYISASRSEAEGLKALLPGALAAL